MPESARLRTIFKASKRVFPGAFTDAPVIFGVNSTNTAVTMTDRQPWAGSNRRQELPPDWLARRARILNRDGHRCTATMGDGSRCTWPASDVDHIKPGNDHSEANLRSLCRWHHARKSSAEGNAARFRSTQRRSPEPHPGFQVVNPQPPACRPQASS